jgi:inhibitor of KinA
LKKYNLTYKKFGETAILIEWPARIDIEIIQDIVSFEKLIGKDQKVIETIVAYNSLTVRYEYMYNYSLHYKYRDSHSKAVEKLKQLYQQKQDVRKQESKIWKIPVCYDAKFGLDLEEVSKAKGLSVDEVIQLHSSSSYLIYFLGFQPGFLYLGGLNEQIHIPRRNNPRLRVEKGSVGIGGEQTGVYPQDSSGGWNIIGKSPIDFFDIQKPKPCFAKAGDKIQFMPVDLDTFCEIEESVRKGTYLIKYL